MAESTITFSASDVQITPSHRNHVEVQVRADLTDVLNEIDVTTIVSHYGSDNLLNEIGQHAAEKYFDLVPSE